MNLREITLSIVLAGISAAAAIAQAPQEQLSEPKSASSLNDSARADAYYNFTMGHIYEQQYEATSNAEYATKAIEAYKKAYALDPKSQVIGERLAEMYWKAQRIHDAVAEAQEILKRDHDKAEQVLRSILKTDPESEPTVEQLTQLLMDEGKSAEAVTLLESITAHSPSAVLLDLLGDAYTQTHELAKAEAAYRQAVDLDP